MYLLRRNLSFAYFRLEVVVKSITTLRVFILGTTLTLLLGACSTAAPTSAGSDVTAEQVSTQGLKSMNYRNIFREWNPKLTNGQVQSKLDAAWSTYFTDAQTKLYFTKGSDTGYIKDFYNGDVRSEGISYGMMIAVQMNKKEVFNKLWKFATTYMRHNSGPRKGYFAWRVGTNGNKLDKNSAPDGELYMAAALYFASGRWGDGSAPYNYKAQADQLVTVMLHKEDQNGGLKNDPNVNPNVADQITNFFQFDNAYHSGKEYNQVVFVPSVGSNSFTDPSYHLPAFFELFSRWSPLNTNYGAAINDRQRWQKIRDASRGYLFGRAVNPITGLTPDYSNFDGSPKTTSFNSKSQHFSYDSWRVGMNWGVDQAWFDPGADYGAWADDLQNFMKPRLEDLANTYELNGEVVENYPGSDPGLVAIVATAGLAATDQGNVKRFARELWNAQAPTDPSNRYCSGLLYFLGLLNASSRYRIYCPASLTC